MDAQHVDSARAAGSRRARLQAWAVAALALLSYMHTTGFEFVYDTPGYLADLDRFLPLHNLRHLATRRYMEWSHEVTYRPALTVTYLWDHVLWRTRPSGFHFSNVLMHAAASVLVWAVVRRALGRGAVAFVAAALFAVHPLTQRPVCPVNGRCDVLATLWLLAAVLCHDRAGKGPRRGRWAMGAVGCFVLSTLSKDTGLVFPVLAVALDAGADLRRVWRRRWEYAAYAAALAALLAVRWAVYPGMIVSSLAESESRYDAQPARTVLCYLAWLLFPGRVHPGPAWVAPGSYYWAPAWPAAVVVAAALVAAAGWARRSRTVRWALAWAIVTGLPVANLIAMPRTPDSRFLYMPLVGWCVAVAAVLCRPREGSTRPWRPAAAVGMAVALALWSLADHDRWSADPVLWRSTVRDYPAAGDGRKSLARVYQLAGRTTLAAQQYEAAWRVSDRGQHATRVLANAYLQLGRASQSVETFRGLLGKYPDDADSWMGLGLALFWSGEQEEGVAALTRSTDLRPDFAPAWFNLGRALDKLGRHGEAAAARQKYERFKDGAGARMRRPDE